MKERLMPLVMATVVAIPHPAHAASYSLGLAACAEAVAQQLAESQDHPVDFEIGGPDSKSTAPMQGRTVFYLDVQDKRSGNVVVRANCVVDPRANVRELVLLSPVAPDTQERSDVDYG